MFRRLFGAAEPDPAEEPMRDETIGALGSAGDADAGDVMLIEQLRLAGAKLDQPRDVRHYLYLPTDAAAATAADTLRGAGYTTEVRPAAGPPGPNPWLVLANSEMTVSAETVMRARALFTRLAAEGGGEYDGWEAASVP